MSNFTSATLGQINAPVNILKEFLATFNRRQKCKAAILSWLDGKHYYGQQWVRITFENLAEILGYCRETISRHMKELIFDGLIEEQSSRKFPKDTACEYRLNLEKLAKIIGFSRCEKIDTDVTDISIRCANNPPTSETSLKLFKENNTNVESEKNDEVDWETVAKEIQTREQAHTCHYVEEPGCQILLSSTPHQEQSQTSDYVEKEPVRQIPPSTQHQEQQEVDSTGVIDSLEDQFSESGSEVSSTSDKPTLQEIKKICTELKRLRINPEPCLGVVKKYWGNVQGAIARVKEAIQEGWCDNPTGLFINSCKSGVKPKNTVTTEVSAWFEWARKERIVLAMSGRVVYTLSGEAVEIGEMMRRYPFNNSLTNN